MRVAGVATSFPRHYYPQSDISAALQSHWTHFRQRVLGALERQNEAFESMLAIHTGSKSAINFGVGPAVRLGWSLLHA